jgi:hypothetical protein
MKFSKCLFLALSLPFILATSFSAFAADDCKAQKSAVDDLQNQLDNLPSTAPGAYRGPAIQSQLEIAQGEYDACKNALTAPCGKEKKSVEDARAVLQKLPTGDAGKYWGPFATGSFGFLVDSYERCLASKQSDKKVVLCPAEEASIERANKIFLAACPDEPAKYNVKCPDLDANRLASIESYQKCLSVYASTTTDKMVPTTVTDTKVVAPVVPVGLPQ